MNKLLRTRGALAFAAIAGCYAPQIVDMDGSESKRLSAAESRGGTEVHWRTAVVAGRSGPKSVRYFERDGEAWIDHDISLGPVNELLDAEVEWDGPLPSVLEFLSMTKFVDLEIPLEFEAGEFPSGLTASSLLGFNASGISSHPTGSRWTNTNELIDAVGYLQDAVATWKTEVPGLEFVVYDSAEHGEYMQASSQGPCATAGSILYPERRRVRLVGCGNGKDVAHEIGHVIGMEHLQRHKDRSTVLDIYAPPLDGQYHVLSGAKHDMDMPFDFGSVMLYPSYEPVAVVVIGNPDLATLSSGSPDMRLDIRNASWGGAVEQTLVTCGKWFHASEYLRNTPRCHPPTSTGDWDGKYEVSYDGHNWYTVVPEGPPSIDGSGAPYLEFNVANVDGTTGETTTQLERESYRSEPAA